MQCVLEVLRGETGRTVDAPEWKAALSLAEEDQILPFFAAKLRTSGLILPDAILTELTHAEREASTASFWWTCELKGVLVGFDAQRIPVIVLKGPSLAERLYGATSLRSSRDLDLLVHQEDIPAAASLLVTLGFAPDLSPDDYHHSWRRGSTMVELHFNVENPLAFNFKIHSVWEKAMPGEFAGQPVWLLAPADELLFLCLHGLRHGYARLTYVLDVAIAFDRLGPEITPQIDPVGSLLPGPESRLDHLLLLGRAMALRLSATPKPALKIAASPRTSAHMERFAEDLWQSLLDRPAGKMDWEQQHRLYRQAEPSKPRRLLRRLMHLRILATRLIDLDFAFAERFGIRNTRLVWLLRPVRLVAQKLSPARKP